MPAPDVTIRPAVPGDASALAGLAALDSSRPLTGRVLVAEVAGEPWAALSLDSHQAIADPFRPARGLVALLAERAGQVRRHEERRSRRRPVGGRRGGVRFPVRAFTGGP